MSVVESPPLSAPALAGGVELLGEYTGSALTQPPSLLRRPDGRVVEVSRLLYLVASELDGRRDADAIAERVSDQFGREVSAENITYLIEKKLQPLGVVAGPVEASLDGPAQPVLSLAARHAILPAKAIAALTTAFRPLFYAPVVTAVLCMLLAIEQWLVLKADVAGAVNAAVARPIILLEVGAFSLLGGLVHELGHGTALRRAGGTPGRIGVGVYVFWPAFFTDVTDAYRLDRRGRIQTDLGGLYFSAIFVAAIFGAYLATHYEPLVLLLLVESMQMAQQLVPLGRTDGYYLLGDAIGVPDLYASARPILNSFRPGRSSLRSPTSGFRFWPRLTAATALVTSSAVTVAVIGLLAVRLPAIVGSLHRSSRAQVELVSKGIRTHDVPSSLLGLLQLAILAVGVVGFTIIVARVVAGVLRRRRRPAADQLPPQNVATPGSPQGAGQPWSLYLGTGPIARYVAEMCGTRRAPALTRSVLAAVGHATGETAGVEHDVLAVRAAQAAVFAELGRTERRISNPARLVGRLRGCHQTPVRLWMRAEGVMPYGEFARLYSHLDACRHCSEIARRSSDGEAELQSAMTAIRAAAASSADAAAGRSVVPWQNGRPAARRRTARRGASSRRRAAPVIVLVAVTALCLAGVLTGAFSRGQRGLPLGRNVLLGGRPGSPGALPSTHGLRAPFVIAGARYAVFEDPDQGWTEFTRTPPGRGRSWATITVRVRNLDMSDFDPRVLTYRLVDGAGRSYAPRTTIGTGPDLLRPPRPLAAGQLIETHLAFSIPAGVGGRLLRFRPVADSPWIVIRLAR